MLLRAAGLPLRLVKNTASGAAYLRLAGLARSRIKTARQLVHPRTSITWRISEGSIVETGLPSSEGFGLSSLLARVLSRYDNDPPKITMLNALTALEMAANDPRVSLLDVRVVPAAGAGSRPVSLGLGFAQAQELRQAVMLFNYKKSKQFPSGGWGSSFTIASFDDQLTYYFASAFTFISMLPTGKVPLSGISWAQLHHKNLLEALGIDMQTGTRMEHNSSGAHFTESEIPEKHHESNLSVRKSLNDTLVSDIANSRSFDIMASFSETYKSTEDPLQFVQSRLRTVMAKLGPYIDAEWAQSIGLITDVSWDFIEDNTSVLRQRTDIGAYVKACRQEIERESRDRSTFHPILDKLIQLVRGQAAANKHRLLRAYRSQDRATVGVVYLLGAIERGGENGANLVAKALVDAALDPEVHSVVVRVDSPGGDFVACSTVSGMISMVQNMYGKPVIASYGNTAASGAYSATSSCNMIVASRSTLTGGIGVSSMCPESIQHMADPFKTNSQLSPAFKPESHLHELEGDKLESYKRFTDKSYEWIVGLIALGRRMAEDEVASIAQGQMFTGDQAAKNKLVDNLMGFTQAVEIAAHAGYRARGSSLHRMTCHYHNTEKDSAQRKFTAQVDLPMNDGGGYQVPTQLDPRTLPKVDEVFTEEFTQAVEQGRYLEKIDDPTRKYVADITKNIRIKEFSAPATGTNALLSMFAKRVGGDLLREAAKSALHQECNSVATSISATQQPRAQVNIMGMK
ncbi:hypothetical protein IWW57_000607 [Coemansia sp. S610]|nr:hypothetical protein IWW57_000607 [Coemansia sp. S610]